MDLDKAQKEHLLTLIAAGLKTREINRRAGKFRKPYTVSRQQVDYYRDSRGVALKAIEADSESEALRTGHALRENRVETLNELAELMKADLLGGKLWLRRGKAAGEKEFNLTELKALRDLLDDIAKEVGGRTYGMYDEGEAEDGAEGEGESGPQELRIKVEYVGGDRPEAPDASPVAEADRP
jgi:hypothetical protein